MSRRAFLVTLLGLALAACVPPGAVLPPPSGAPELDVTVTPASGAEAGEVPAGVDPSAGSAEGAAYVPGEFLVGLSPEADPGALARSLGASVKGEIRFSGRYVHMALPAGTTLEAGRAMLAGRPEVTSVAPNWRLQPAYLTSSQSPSDGRYAEQWSHQLTNALPAWRALGSGFTASNVAIAVLDTGLDTGHPEFEGRVLAGRNFTTEHGDTRLTVQDDVSDLYGHGTHVAGIAAAAGNNAVGMAGLAWDAKILPVKVLGRTGGTTDGILNGIRYAVDYPTSEATVRVINMSIQTVGRFASEAIFADAMAYAWRRGVVVVVAAGNQGGDVVSPAINPHNVTVSATTAYEYLPGLFAEYLAGFSNRGDRIDVAAPGADILSTVPQYHNSTSQRIGLVTRPVGDDTSTIDAPYAFNNGTSMAAPYVAGLAALIVARYDPFHLKMNALFSDRVAERLKSTADDLGPIGRDPYFGYGRVNVQKALAPSSL